MSEETMQQEWLPAKAFEVTARELELVAAPVRLYLRFARRIGYRGIVPRAVGLAVILAHSAGAQQPAPAVGIGFGVDTTDVEVRAIVRLVRTYLAAPSSARRAGLWEKSSDSTDHTHDDLAARYALQGFPATIVGVLRQDGGDSVYVVKVLHARAERSGSPVSALALQRLYVVRTVDNRFGWRLHAALPRLTRAWATRRFGRMIFHYEPGQIPNDARAAEASHFVDSVAALFDARPPARIDYYVTASPEDYFRALGLDFFVVPSGSNERTGGNALPDAGVMLAGDPVQGELYRHELVHVALGRRVPSGFIGEGIAVWLGGSRGRSARELYRVLAKFQRAHGTVTFTALVRDKLSVPSEATASSDAWYATGTLVCEMIYRRGGVAGLRALADAPANSDAMLHVLAKLLGVADDASALDRWWRRAAPAAEQAGS